MSDSFIVQQFTFYMERERESTSTQNPCLMGTQSLIHIQHPRYKEYYILWSFLIILPLAYFERACANYVYKPKKTPIFPPNMPYWIISLRIVAFSPKQIPPETFFFFLEHLWLIHMINLAGRNSMRRVPVTLTVAAEEVVCGPKSMYRQFFFCSDQ